MPPLPLPREEVVEVVEVVEVAAAGPFAAPWP